MREHWFTWLSMLWLMVISIEQTYAVEQPETGYRYIASKKSQVYHELSCEWAQKMKPGNRIYFKTIEEAEATGRRPCKVCSAGKAQPVSEGVAAKTETMAKPRDYGEPVTMSGGDWRDIAIFIIVVASISSVTVLFLYLWKARRAHERPLRIFILPCGSIIIGVEGLHRDENAHERRSRDPSVFWRSS